MLHYQQCHRPSNQQSLGQAVSAHSWLLPVLGKKTANLLAGLYV